MALPEIDYCEYATDSAAQTAYVTNAGEFVDQQGLLEDQGSFNEGDASDNELRQAQSFQLSQKLTVTAIELKQGTNTGSPTGNWTIRVETDSSGVPSGTLADANATVTVAPPGTNTIVKASFATPFDLAGSTTYWIKINCDNQTTNNRFGIIGGSASSYAGGAEAESTNGEWAVRSYDLYFKIYCKTLQVFSESTIKTQGSYSLKGVASKVDTEAVMVQQTSTNVLYSLEVGDVADDERRNALAFTLTAPTTITAVERRRDASTYETGTPSGNWTFRIETADGSNLPSGTLAHANASVVVTPPANSTVIKGTFANEFILTAGTYWFVLQCDNQSTNNWWMESGNNSTPAVKSARYRSSTGVWADLGAGQDLYYKIYNKIGGSLNKTLTHTF